MERRSIHARGWQLAPHRPMHLLPLRLIRFSAPRFSAGRLATAGCGLTVIQGRQLKCATQVASRVRNVRTRQRRR
jgi:hypothetical protein